jgi:RNA polymerase sigma factor (sigma-70 family)
MVKRYTPGATPFQTERPSEHKRDEVQPNSSFSKAAQQQGAEEFYEGVFKEMFPRVLAIVKRHGFSREEAEDLAQETMSLVLRHINDSEARNIMSFTFAVAMNVIRNNIRQEMRRGRSAPHYSIADFADYWGAALVDRKAADPLEEILSKEKMVRVAKAFDQLPHRSKDLLRLSLLGRSNEEIAGILGIPRATLRVRMFRARQAWLAKVEELEEQERTSGSPQT